MIVSRRFHDSKKTITFDNMHCKQYKLKSYRHIHISNFDCKNTIKFCVYNQNNNTQSMCAVELSFNIYLEFNVKKRKILFDKRTINLNIGLSHMHRYFNSLCGGIH